MKTKSLFTIFAVSALALAACKPDDPTTPPDPVTPEYIPGTLVAEDNRTSVTLREGTDETRTLAFTYQTDKELSEERNVTVAVDAASTLPKANYELPGTFTVAAGADESELQTITFKATGLQAGEYTLVLTESVEDGQTAFEPLEINVTVRTPQTGKYEFFPDYTTVCYVNTNDYQPLLANAYLVTDDAFASDAAYYYMAEIVNLRTIVLKNNNGRAELVLGRDMEHVLANRTKYIIPLQDQGRKVCLTLEGGGTGLGFCNLTDEQIDDFVAQVRKVIYDNDLDGVNFYDKGASYDQAASNGLPEMNTTSYPKLIKKMRESLPGKLVTLADYDEPTAYFHDTEATDGIKVGDYIDYAWSGYMAVNEPFQILDPWGLVDKNDPKVKEAEELSGFSSVFPFAKDERKPIAGLPQEKYGNFACPYYSGNQQAEVESEMINLIAFSYCGWWKSKIFVIGDMIPNLQGEYETAWQFFAINYELCMPSMMLGTGDSSYNIVYNEEEYPNEMWQYGFFAKDWE